MHRQIILLSGEHKACLKVAKKLIKVQGGESKKNQDVVAAIDYTAKNCLGQEFDVALVDLFEPFDANAFAAISGTIRGGGALVLLFPEKTEFPQSLFLQRFYRVLNSQPYQGAIRRINVAENNIQPDVSLEVPEKTRYSTIDQKKAIEAILHVVKGHRRRPLLISADR
jgi:tRNA(Met) cytidine acetyltransferase